jgi:hypothetical protein
MSNKNNRVLTRMGAREISVQELDAIHGSGGSPICTLACTILNDKTTVCDSECHPPH